MMRFARREFGFWILEWLHYLMRPMRFTNF
jgi:hypothetical protein